MADKKKSVSKDDALEMAKNIGCSGVHEVDGSWMPCESAEELARISEAAGSNLEVPFSIPKGANEMKISSSGRKRRRLVDRKRWEKLTERSYGMVGTSAGIVSAPPAPPASPMGGIVSSGSGPGITGDMGGGGKGIMPFSPEVGDPDTFTSPDAARMRAAQVGCTGIRRYTTSSGRQVWMPCTTGVTFDRRTGQGAYRNERSRTEQQRIERIVRREVARSASFSGTKKSLRGSRTSRRNARSVSVNQDATKSLIIAAREHNVMMRSIGMPQWSFASTSELKSVMRRGVAAFDSLNRPDLGNRSKWGEMRVEAYLKMLSSGRPDNPKYISDNDLLKKEHPWAEAMGTKALPRDADRDGWIDENEPLKRRFVGFATDVADAVRNAGSRVRGRKPKSRVRVVSSEGSTGRESRGIARSISARIEDTINELRDGEPEKNIFVPDITQDVPGSLSSSRLRGLLPSRKSHYKLVETQRNFPHAPTPAGEHKGASVEDLMQPNGKMTSTFEHFGLGSGMTTPERQALHDSIIESIMFGNGKWSPRRSDKPMAWMMGGGPASGKTFLRQGGFFDTPQRGSEAVHLDADEIKHMLPEFDTLVKELQEKGMDPLQAAELVHSESTYIQKLAIKRAAEEGFHVVVDSTGDGGPKAFAERMKALKDNGYAIKGRIADVPIAMALAEAERRKLETGRGVPPTVVTDTHIDVARALLHGLQNGVYDDLEIVNNEDHSNPYTIAAYKDGVLVVHDQAAWKQILHKAGLGSVQKYEDVNYFAEEGKAKFIASKRIADRKIRTAKIEGFDSVIAEPAKALADALPGGVDYSKVKAVTEERRQELAAAYEKMETVSKEAEQAYEDLRAETDRLYEALTKDMGINVEFVDNDPYRSHLEMIDDIEMNKTLKVKRTTPDEKHPLWDDEQSDRFRAIHDAFGHAATGRGFDRHGEEAAYQAHASLVEGELAKKALETELQAQNAAILTTGVVPPRKAGLIPEQPSTKADAGGKLSSMPQLITKPDVPATEDNQTPIPLTADDDNFYSTTMCHHLSGGRTVAQSDVVVPTDKLYDRLGNEPALSPETRQMIYRAAISGVSIEDSDVDETNKDIVAYYKLMQKSLKKMGKGVVADIPVSGVESVPYPMVKK